MYFSVLSDEECDQFIKITEEMKYTGALITTFGGMVEAKDIRNNQRIIWQLDQKDEILDVIWSRIKNEMPESEKLYGIEFLPIGLNERLR